MADHLIVLGFLLFLAFKTKQLTMAAGIVLPGSGCKDEAIFDFCPAGGRQGQAPGALWHG
jgi:hypothetical protein